MTCIKCVVFLSAALFMALAASSVRADDPKFAVVTINNGTADVTITFDWCFGDGKWNSYKLPPGKAVALYNPLDANQQSVPPQIMFQEGINKAKPFKKTKTLQFYAAADTATNLGYSYTFNRDAADADYIHLDDTSGQ